MRFVSFLTPQVLLAWSFGTRLKTDMACDTVLRCFHHGVTWCVVYLTVLQTLVILPGTGLPTCSLHTLFSTPQTYQDHPRPFWLMSPDPLQPKPHAVTKWIIQPTEIQVSHGWTRRDFRAVGSYTLTCVRGFDGATRKSGTGDQPEPAIGKSQSKILFTLNDGSDEGGTKYVCMVITKRGPIIFQTKMSKVAADASAVDTVEAQLCSEGSLEDKGLTFVNFEDASTGWTEYVEGLLEYVPCPINGGYTITSWTDETGSTKCETPKMGNLRVEDECEPGKGVVFSEGISQDCKNPLFGEIYKDDPLRCYSKWSDGGYDYAVALAEDPSAVYCMRVAQNRSTETDVYIFKDGICDATTDILHSKKYVKIGLLTHTIPARCSDISPWCGTYNAQELSRPEIKPLCDATLGQCADRVFWDLMTVPDHYRGSWYRETVALGVDTIHITDSLFTSQYLGGWRFAGEAVCASTTHGLQDQGKFYFLISQPGEDGCRPRVALLWLMPVSSTVLLFQLSRGEILLHGDGYTSPATICTNHQFTFGETNQILKDRYYVDAFAWQNLVKTVDNPPSVKCDISEWDKLQVTFPQGQTCSVRLQQDGDSAFTVTVQSCTKAVQGLPINKPIHHACLAQYKGTYGWASFLITRTSSHGGAHSLGGGGRQYLCWLFEDPRGLLMPVGDCSDETVGEVLDMKSKTALAELSLTAPVTGSGRAPVGAPVTLGVCLSVLRWFSYGR